MLSITSQGIVVEHEGQKRTCFLRGLLKKDKDQAKNLITVGDFVLFEPAEDNEGLIAHVEPRKSMLSRADNLSRKKEQLIAANIDQVLITTSVVNPLLKPSLIDRYIIAAEKGGMAPIIVVNKIDLLEQDPAEAELYEEFLAAYAKAEVPVIAVSAEKNIGLDKLKEVMKDKASVFSGQSGVGKSSLINVMTGLDLKVGEPVERTKKGAHTTSLAQLIPLEFGGWCIDTPGIKSFGIWDLDKQEIVFYFPEFQPYAQSCKFPDCSHTIEEQCGVKDAVEKGEISVMRYTSYYALYEGADEEHLRR